MLYSSLRLGEQQYPTVATSRGEGLRALYLLTGTCLLMTISRGLLSHNWWFFICLTWNLFLAWFPLGVMLVWRDLGTSGLLGRGRLYYVGVWVALGTWLVFMPNAPYIITDLFHLRATSPELLYFDTLSVFLSALTGLLAGLYSSLLAHRVLLSLTRYVPAQPIIVWGLMLGFQFLAGFGVYLGRYIRLNSWDIVASPLWLLRSLWESATSRFALKVTLTYGIPLAILYVAFYIFAHARYPQSRS
jgi:uncharacterized membrane protein